MLERRQGVNFRVNMKKRGEVFGEVALMYNVPRTATVAATKASLVWVLERDLYRSPTTPPSASSPSLLAVTHQILLLTCIFCLLYWRNPQLYA